MLTVKNVLGEDFDLCCKRLCSNIREQDYIPDIIIGVLTGGGYVGRKVFKEFEAFNQPIFYKEIKLQRKSTKAKSDSKVRKIFKILPYSVLNIMRILEMELLELKAKFVKPSRCGTIDLDEETIALLKHGGMKVLLVDDAIDTGMTLKIVKNFLVNQFNETNDIKIAVVTSTNRNPVMVADFFLYNRVLIRFPWASDVKESSNY